MSKRSPLKTGCIQTFKNFRDPQDYLGIYSMQSHPAEHGIIGKSRQLDRNQSGNSAAAAVVAAVVEAAVLVA